MPFSRRTPLSFLHHLRAMFWPDMGWQRTLRYYRIRIARLDDSPECISKGIASGIAVSFLPLPIVQLILAPLLSAVLRGNLTASMISTFVANAWTIPFMWYLSYIVGRRLYESMGIVGMAEFPATFSLSDLWHAVRAQPEELMIPWVAGGAVIGFVMYPMAYYFCRGLVVAERKLIKRRLKLPKTSKSCKS
jgi:uncharacterized protein